MTASDQITDYIANLKDWRGDALTRVREIIHEEVPDVVEEWKWRAPVWSNNGLMLAASGFKTHVGINFFHGAELPDPEDILTATDAKSMRSIKLTKADTLNEPAFRELVRAAAAHNAKASR